MNCECLHTCVIYLLLYPRNAGVEKEILIRAFTCENNIILLSEKTINVNNNKHK